MIDVLILNLNCLAHTKNIIDDLRRQTVKQFHVTLVDQASVEDGTEEYLLVVEGFSWITVVRNSTNVSITVEWNKFVANSEKPYVAILNNDIRITNNFIEHTVITLQNPEIGLVMHPTNHPMYERASSICTCQILPSEQFMQGWDICMKRELWTPIPEGLKLYSGDAFQHEEVYKQGYKAVMVTSAPIIHYEGATQHGKLNGKVIKDFHGDIGRYTGMGYERRLTPPINFSIAKFSRSKLEWLKDADGSPIPKGEEIG
jgi:GT2 family glycosyltransferase